MLPRIETLLVTLVRQSGFQASFGQPPPPGLSVEKQYITTPSRATAEDNTGFLCCLSLQQTGGRAALPPTAPISSINHECVPEQWNRIHSLQHPPPAASLPGHHLTPAWRRHRTPYATPTRLIVIVRSADVKRGVASVINIIRDKPHRSITHYDGHTTLMVTTCRCHTGPS